MQGKHLRLTSPTIAIQTSDRRAITVPAGESITLLASSGDDGHLIDVDWKGVNLRMFAQDVRDRGENIEPE